MFLSSLIIPILVINTILGLSIFIENPKRKTNQYYALIVLFVTLFIISVFFENKPNLVGINQLEIFLRLDFTFAIFIFYTWFRFCMVFTQRVLFTRFCRIFKKSLLAFALLLSYLSLFTDMIIRDVSFVEGLIQFEAGPLWPLYAFSLLGLAIGGVVLLLIKKKDARNNNDIRLIKQINTILIGVILSLGNGLLFFLILQPFVPFTIEMNNLGLYGITFLTVATAYAIVRHQFLNIQVITTALLVFVLWSFLLVRVFIEPGSSEKLVDVSILIVAIPIGILLIRSVSLEIKARARSDNLALELKKTNEYLKQLDQRKSEFLSLASHQLRAPLTAIKGYSSMLVEGSYGQVNNKHLEPIERIFHSSDRLIELVDDFLILSRIEQDILIYTFTLRHLDTLITEVIEEMRPIADEKGISIAFHKVDGDYRTMVDDTKIRQVIGNVIDNAIKYTTEGSINISLSHNVSDNKIHITITDTGMGISKETLKVLFKKFTRANTAWKVSVEGLGLGLYIAHRIISEHGGRLWAESEGEMKGSTFHIELPIRSTAPVREK